MFITESARYCKNQSYSQATVKAINSLKEAFDSSIMSTANVTGHQEDSLESIITDYTSIIKTEGYC